MFFSEYLGKTGNGKDIRVLNPRSYSKSGTRSDDQLSIITVGPVVFLKLAADPTLPLNYKDKSSHSADEGILLRDLDGEVQNGQSGTGAAVHSIKCMACRKDIRVLYNGRLYTHYWLCHKVRCAPLQ